jgi:hypothetical protein
MMGKNSLKCSENVTRAAEIWTASAKNPVFEPLLPAKFASKPIDICASSSYNYSDLSLAQ